MPDIGTNAPPVLFGDFQQGYLIAYDGGLRITVDDDISTPCRVRWYVRRRVGGIPADQHSVVAIKCAVSQNLEGPGRTFRSDR